MIYDPWTSLKKKKKKTDLHIKSFLRYKEIKKKKLITDYYIIITLWISPKKQEIYSFRSFQLSSFLQ